MVPGSMFKYGSNLIASTSKPEFFKSRPIDAVVIPFPRPETTPPVTKMNLDTYKSCEKND
jgi:hypothetical protein